MSDPYRRAEPLPPENPLPACDLRTIPSGSSACVLVCLCHDVVHDAPREEPQCTPLPLAAKCTHNLPRQSISRPRTLLNCYKMGLGMAGALVGVVALVTIGVKAAMPLFGVHLWSDANLTSEDVSEPPVEEGVPLRLMERGMMTHDPRELWARALRLRDMGEDVHTRRFSLSRAEVEAFLAGRGPSFAILVGANHPGVRISSSNVLLARGAPLQNDDIVTAINGYDIDHPREWFSAATAAYEKGDAVLEILRDGKPQVVRVLAR